MNDLLITDWQDIDTIDFYTKQLSAHALAYSKEQNSWVAYSYEVCKSLLLNNAAVIPAPVLPEGSHPDHIIQLLINNLARLNNGSKHQLARSAAMLLYTNINAVNMQPLVQPLLYQATTIPFDWVASVSKKLPVMLLLKGLGVQQNDSSWIMDHIELLVKLNAPDKTIHDINDLNQVTDRFFHIVSSLPYMQRLAQQLIHANPTVLKTEALDVLACNLLGLFIQSYDAGRALLTNAVIQLAALKARQATAVTDKNYLEKFITEVLRIDPPVHTTRRIAAADIHSGNQLIKAGQPIVIVMAAANLDEEIFNLPRQFDPFRANNDLHLSFGSGGHACLAKRLVMDMAVETCAYLAANYTLNIPAQPMEFEPHLNARHLKNLIINFNTY